MAEHDPGANKGSHRRACLPVLLCHENARVSRLVAIFLPMGLNFFFVFFLSDTASTYSTLRIPRQYPAGPASPARSAQSPHVRTPRAGHPLGYGVMRRAWSTALRRRPATAAVLAQVLGAPRVTKVASLPLGPPGEPPSPSPRPSSSSSSSSESISPSASASSSPACPQRWA